MVTLLVFIIATLEKVLAEEDCWTQKAHLAHFVVLKSLLGMERQWSREKLVILPTKPRSHV